MVNRFCKDCGVLLTTDNWYPSDMKVHQYRCKLCRRIRTREWRKAHPKQSLEIQRRYRALHPKKRVEWERKHHRKRLVITSGGIRLHGNKRPYPEDECCELCGRKGRLLAYHHYYDFDLTKGLWLCVPCHVFAEFIDRGYLCHYLKLREQLLEVRYELTYKHGLLVSKISPLAFPLLKTSLRNACGKRF